VLVALLASFRRLSARAEHHAAHDSLTGLVNRRSVYSTLEVMMDRARMTGRPLGVASLDLDHFKRINDQKGHETVTWSSPPVAWCSRLLPVERRGGAGGWRGVPDPAAGHRRGRHHGRCGEDALGISGIAIPALEWPLTASLGVTMLDADDSGADLLRRADKALYAAKAGGRNRAMLVDVGA
jgi:GGDEF domain-containing protein